MTGRQLTKAEHAAKREAERAARQQHWQEVERPRRKGQVLAEVQRRGLASFMNETRWEALKAAVYSELPFPPAFQVQGVLGAREPALDPDTVWGGGAWSELHSCFEVEWIQVVPRYRRPVGALVEPEVVDATTEFRALLERLRIPFREDDTGSFWIYGYAPADPATLTPPAEKPT